MTDESDSDYPPHVDAFLDRLIEALPPNDSMSQDDVICTLAIFVGGVLESMEGASTVVLIGRFMEALGVAAGGAVLVSVRSIEEEPGTRH